MKKRNKKRRRFLLLSNTFLLVGTVLMLYQLESEKTYTVNANVAYIRQSPKENGKIIAQKTYHQPLKVIREQNNWYEVDLGNKKTGWVASWLLHEKGEKPSLNRTAYVIKDSSLYSNYYKESEIVTDVLAHQKVTLLQKMNGWYFVRADHNYGWIPMTTISEVMQTPNKIAASLKKSNVKPKIVYIRQEETKLRQKASTQSAIVSTLSAGDKVTVLENKKDGFYYVETSDGKKGYIASWLVSKENLSTSNKKVNRLKDATIVLDPGHGGQDAGSVSSDDRYEKEAALETAKAVQKELKAKGAKVIMTRSDDTFVGLAERANISNRNKADAFICIHFDSTERKNQASGTTTYYYHKNSIELANDINNQLKSLPLKNRGVEFGNHQVTRDNNEPAILLELGYMSTEHDVNYIFDSSYQKQIAVSITNGLETYFNQQKTEQSSSDQTS